MLLAQFSSSSLRPFSQGSTVPLFSKLIDLPQVTQLLEPDLKASSKFTIPLRKLQVEGKTTEEVIDSLRKVYLGITSHEIAKVRKDSSISAHLQSLIALCSPQFSVESFPKHPNQLIINTGYEFRGTLPINEDVLTAKNVSKFKIISPHHEDALTAKNVFFPCIPKD